MNFNPIGWFEIYVEDMGRAAKFYEEVLQVKLENLPMPGDESGMQMRSFPGGMENPGATGALVKMEGVAPGGSGIMIYFVCEDCAVEEGRVAAAGGAVIRTKMSIGEYGFCSMIKDSEGNVVGLHSMS